MELMIEHTDGNPHRSKVVTYLGDGRTREHEVSTRYSEGYIVKGDDYWKFAKYFVTNRTQKQRQDFIIVSEVEAPPITETLARLNRALSLGQKVIRHSRVEVGAKLLSTGSESDEERAFTAVPPITLENFANLSQYSIGDDGDGLFWMRFSNRFFDLFAANPAISERKNYGAFISVESPDTTSPNLNHIKWDYADALLTPSEAPPPGFLGNVSLREAIVGLRPDISGEIVIPEAA